MRRGALRSSLIRQLSVVFHDSSPVPKSGLRSRCRTRQIPAVSPKSIYDRAVVDREPEWARFIEVAYVHGEIGVARESIYPARRVSEAEARRDVERCAGRCSPPAR